MNVRDLIDLGDFTLDDWHKILYLAEDIYQDPMRYSSALHGKILATLFYEPSTRTQMSFQAAMMRLGGQNIGFKNPSSSSISKGENLKDTIRIVSGYSDILVIRHPKEGSARAASLFSACPVINAGDGGHLHPTQTLTDLFTLRRVKGRLQNLRIGLCGDLKYGRTVHSLIRAMSRFPGNRFTLISTPELTLPDYLVKETGAQIERCDSLEACIGDLDVLYMTRIQQERFASKEEYARQKGVYILDAEKMRLAKPDLAVLHPLPRIDEIDRAVDDDPRAVYFRQAEYGMYVRMAIILLLVTEQPDGAVTLLPAREGEHCANPSCILEAEPYIGQKVLEEDGGPRRCAFCEHAL